MVCVADVDCAAQRAPAHRPRHEPSPCTALCAQVLSWVAGRGPLARPRQPFRAVLAFLAIPALPAAPGSRHRYQHSWPASALKHALLLAAAHALACRTMPRWLLGVLQCECGVRRVLAGGAGVLPCSPAFHPSTCCPSLPHVCSSPHIFFVQHRHSCRLSPLPLPHCDNAAHRPLHVQR